MAAEKHVEEPVKTFTSKLPATAVVIMDDFLSPPIPEDEIDRIDKMKDNTVAGKYNWAFKSDIPKVSSHLHRFYKRAVEVMGLDEDQILGIEFWINTFGPGDGIHMHSDLDETLYRRTRRMECAIAGTMCFAATHDLKGGSFVFEDGVTVRPRKNRGVLFFGGTRHGVEPVTHGVRKAVLVAFWHRMPTAHREAAAQPNDDRKGTANE
ncbi:2OG-Fe(II) oxygenase [Bradyrhizobium pachyrhizi]|uniref:2OG-Fe(II) oxygenase n=1 Tax=Bradyrhizobium pachyrhizi TaxID=280333 RepID=UPI0024B1A3FD|nr:2OG-Fe(II) oxygenase [Bradyrhizobium pachyrhizi]WFU53629.1 2OG-Fe(II) oxygenase [Bradyrhizobium pachyrhizi]